VGIDLNETNAVVAVDADGREFFQSGKATKVRNQRTMQATKRVQRKLATRKAEGKDTHGVSLPSNGYLVVASGVHRTLLAAPPSD